MDDKRTTKPLNNPSDGNDGYTNPIARTGEQQWVPVEERLPKSGEQVLGALRGTSGKYNISRINYTSKAQDHDWEADGFEIGNCWTVTHWMPLPEPPEQEEE